MNSTQLPQNVTTLSNTRSSKTHNLDLSCYPYESVYFEVYSSNVPYIVNASVNGPLLMVSVLMNVFVLHAIHRTTSIRLPSKLLLSSLVLTDLTVGVIVQPQYVIFLIAKVNVSFDISCFCLKSCGFFSAQLFSVSLLTMTAISIDRYTALFFHNKYKQIVTTKRVFVIIAVVWSLSAFYASTWLWNKTLNEWISFFGIIVCFIAICVSYMKIYHGLHHHRGIQVEDTAQGQARRQTAGKTALDIAKYRKSTSNMLWIYGLFLLCYSPYFCVHSIAVYFIHNAFIQCIAEVTLTIVFFNSCLNPFIYCIRLNDIRTKVLQTLRNICCQGS